MRFRIPVLALLLMMILFVVPAAAHAAIPFFGPIVPEEINRCAANWGAIIIVINNIISFIITIIIVFVAPLMIAYAGFLYVWNPVNPGGMTKARSIVWNTVVGIVVALAAWLIVDAVMAVLYNASTPVSDGSVLKTWSSIINWNSGDPCLIQQSALQDLKQTDLSGAKVTGVSTDGGKFLSLPTNANCSPDTIRQAVQGSSYTLTQDQANTLACIAVAESSCSNTPPPARQPDGTPTSASGMFQIVFGAGNDTCHNLNIPACSQAAGIEGNLNCSSAFRGGLPAPGKEAQAAACKRAAANLKCNAQAAACLVKARNGGFGDWTADKRASTQQNCITKYAKI